MTKKENSLYLLVKSVLAESENFHGKLPKTMMVIRWVKRLEEHLTRRYEGFVTEIYYQPDHRWHSIVLCGETLDRAVKCMLIREITAQGYVIINRPCDLPLIHHTECANDVEWMLRNYLPSRLKQEFNN